MSGEILIGKFRVKLGEKIGHGTHSEVYSAEYEKTNIVAKKCNTLRNKDVRKELAKLQSLLAGREHPHVIEIFGYLYEIDDVWIFMEHCDKGNLAEYSKVYCPAYPARKRIMFQIASALAYMHSGNTSVIHGNLKPENILLKGGEKGAYVKLSDFGVSKFVTGLDLVDVFTYSSHIDKLGYMAPEYYIENSSKTKAVDVFSLGTIFLAILLYAEEDGDSFGLSEVLDGHHRCVGGYMRFLTEFNKPIPKFEDMIPDPPPKDTKKGEMGVIRALLEKLIRYDPKERIEMADVEKILFEQGGKSPLFEGIWKIEEEEVDTKSPDSEQKPLTKDIEKIEWFTSGEKVFVSLDLQKVNKLQPGFGPVRGAERYLGQEGVVVGVRKNIKVRFDDGQELCFHPGLLERTKEYLMDTAASYQPPLVVADEVVRSRFKRSDIVQFLIDEIEVIKGVQEHSILDWGLELIKCIGENGIVVGTIGDEVLVQFWVTHARRWRLSPDIITKIDLSKEKIQEGDFVLVTEDKKLMLRQRHCFENWKDEQLQKAGSVGIVTRIVSEKQILVDADDGDDIYTWHQTLLKLIMKSKDVMKAEIKKDEFR